MTATVTLEGKILEGKGQAIVQKNLDAAIYEAVMILESKIKPDTPVGVGGAQGGLLSTIQGEIQGKGTPRIKGIVFTQSKYGEVIEKGRTAGKAMPPKGVLLKWMELKLGVDETTAKRIEFVVRRKIGQKGFSGVHMFEKGFDNNMSRIRSIFERRGFTIVKELKE